MGRGTLASAAALVASGWFAAVTLLAPGAPPLRPLPARAAAPAIATSVPAPAAAAFGAAAPAGAGLGRIAPPGDAMPAAAAPTVGGFLLDEAGRPLSGPRVELRAVAGTTPVALPGRIDAAGRFCVPVPGAVAGRHAVQCSLVLCADRLELATCGFGPLLLPTTGELELGACRARRSDVMAAGVVLLDGAAAAGCEVAAHRSAADAAAGVAMHRVRSDDDGRFELRGTATGAHLWLTARAPGAVAMPPRAVPAGSEALELRLSRGRLLAGTVLLPAAPPGVDARCWPRLRLASPGAGGEWPIDVACAPQPPDAAFVLRLVPVAVPDGPAELRIQLPGLDQPWATRRLDPVRAADAIEPHIDLVADLRWIPIRAADADRQRLWTDHAPLRVGTGAHALDLGAPDATAGCWWPRDHGDPHVLDRHGQGLPCRRDGHGGLVVQPAPAPRWLTVQLDPVAALPPGSVLRLQLAAASRVLVEATATASRTVQLRRPDDPAASLRLLLTAPGAARPAELLCIPLLGAGDWLWLQPDPSRVLAAPAAAATR